jgi:GNAT superfamily N-acetyltransferase
MRPSQPLRVARLSGLPAGFEELAADAVADGLKVMEVLRADWDSFALRFERPGEALFAAFAGPALLGVCGLTPDLYLKGEEAGRLRRIYVRRAARRHGVGRALLGAVAAQALEFGWERLRDRAPPAAFAFYEACGFLRAVGEPAATHSLALGLSATPGRP